MGRRSLNKTYDEILEQKRVYSKQYYKKNKEKINKKVMERYNKLKREAVNNE